MNEKERRRQEEDNEKHYWSDGTLKGKYTIGFFVPSSYDDMVTNGQASRDFHEALKHQRQMTQEELIKEDNDIFWGIFKLIFGTIGVLILILLFFHAFPLY